MVIIGFMQTFFILSLKPGDRTLVIQVYSLCLILLFSLMGVTEIIILDYHSTGKVVLQIHCTVIINILMYSYTSMQMNIKKKSNFTTTLVKFLVIKILYIYIYIYKCIYYNLLLEDIFKVKKYGQTAIYHTGVIVCVKSLL